MESHLQEVSLLQEAGNGGKNLTMVFELMVSLCIKICANFFTFNMRQII